MEILGLALLVALAGGLVGALLGSWATFRAQRLEHEEARRGAGRAVCLEMMQNAVYMKAALDGQPVTRLSREIFDRELNLIAALLGPDDLRAVTAPYIKLRATLEVLGPFAASGKPLSKTGNARGVAAQAERDFGAGAAALSSRVWTEQERRELAKPRGPISPT